MSSSQATLRVQSPIGGIALSDWGNPFAAGLKLQAQLDQGLKAFSKRAPLLRRLSESVPTLMPSHISLRHREYGISVSRILAYETAMAAVSAAYPDDIEAAIFYALALAAAADPAIRLMPGNSRPENS